MDAKLKKRYLSSISIAALCAGIVILFFLFLNNLYESFETKTLDLRFQLRGAIPQRQDILFLEMDQPAIQALGRWPWPRDTFARILEVLKDCGARAVLFDVTFTEPSQPIVDKERLNSELNLKQNKQILDGFISDTQEALKEGKAGTDQISTSLSQIKEGIDTWEKNIEGVLSNSLIDNDIFLSKAVKDTGNVYLGYHFEVIHTPLDIKRDNAYLKLKALSSAWIKENPQKDFTQAPAYLKEVPGFSSQELKTIFLRAKLHDFLSRNPELKPEDDSFIPHYNDIKVEVFREKLEEALKESPKSSFKELVWKIGLFDGSDIEALSRQYQDYLVSEAFSKKVGISYQNNGDTGFFKAVKLSPPILMFTENMKGAGFLNAIADTDGTLRKVPLFIRYKDRIYPHIALRLVFDLWNIDPQKSLRIIPGRFIIAGDKRIPIDENGCLLLNWAGKWQDSFGHLSAAQAYRFWELKNNLENNLRLSETEIADKKIQQMLNDDKSNFSRISAKLNALIKDNICIIGLTAPGTHDYTPIPLESDYPAVGTHANILNTILGERFLQRIDRKTNLAIILLLALFTAVCVTLLSPAYSLIFIVLTVILYYAVSFFLFAHKGLWIDTVGPVGAGILSYIGIVSYNFTTEEKEKRWIRKAFGHYISKNVMEEILKDPSKLRLGGERKELSVLFADVRSFTSYSEKRQPEEVVAILNEYMDAMTKVIFKYNGTLDKYIGDEIMAVFGTPSATIQNDHAQKAVGAALEMIERLKQLQEKWKMEGKEPLDIGIGINTGEMLAGNMGSSERMEYTVIGDAVNLAARIEALTRTYNNHIIISEFTYSRVKDMIEARQLEAIKVKGKEISVMMYEVLGPKKPSATA